jgi:hypothetical protein
MRRLSPCDFHCYFQEIDFFSLVNRRRMRNLPLSNSPGPKKEGPVGLLEDIDFFSLVKRRRMRRLPPCDFHCYFHFFPLLRDGACAVSSLSRD